MKTLNLSLKSFVVLALLAVGAVSVLGTKQVNAVSTPPDTYVTGMSVVNSNVTLNFKSDQPAIFQCNLDNTVWKSCSSGITWHGLAGTYANPVQHSIQVRAINSAKQVDDTPVYKTLRTPLALVNQVYSVNLSNDGCILTATGPAGLTFEAGAFAPGRGGVMTYEIPASGTLTVSSGAGNNQMTSYGLVYDPANYTWETIFASVEGPVSAVSCPPAGL